MSTTSLCERLSDPVSLLSSCKVALPFWSQATLDNFTWAVLNEENSLRYEFPVLYLVTCNTPGASPGRAVVKLEEDISLDSFYTFQEALVSRDGPYQCRIARQIGDAGLGPHVYYVETNMLSPYWGLMVMEEIPGGDFSQDFNSNNLKEADLEAVGILLGQLHQQPTEQVEQHAQLARELVMKHCSVEKYQIQVEDLYQERGGYILYMIYWWMSAFPTEMSLNSTANYPLPQTYTSRLLACILRLARIKPLTRTLARHGFSHGDLWSCNMMKKGTQILAIDFDSSTVGPAFLDFGAVFFNWQTMRGIRPHMAQCMRETIAMSFYETVGVECEEMDSILYDIELAIIHRYIWFLFLFHFSLVSEPLETLEEVGGLMIEKMEVMVRAMEKAVDDKELMSRLVEKGVYWTVRHELSDGHEEKLNTFVETKKK